MATATKTAEAPRKRTPSAQRIGRAAEAGRTATVNLPFVTAQFRVHEMHVPQLRAPSVHLPRPHVPRPHVPRPREVADAANVVRSYLPARERLAYYGGLGAATALGVIEGPVAVAIGAGTVIAQRARREGGQRSDAPSKRSGAAQ